MRQLSMSLVFLAVAMVASVGCNSSTTTGNGENENGNDEHGHTHEAGDELVWPVKEKVGETDITIWYGHHGKTFHGGDSIEPAVAISSNGEAISDWKVHVSLLDPADNGTEVAAKVATVFEPETDEEIAHYAQGELKIPDDAKNIIIRFQIEGLTGNPEIIRDVTIDLAH